MSQTAGLADGNAQPFYLARNESYGAVQPGDDYLHHAVNATVADDSLTETQYFGLEIPEHRIHVTCYLWHHVNLNTVTGGVWAFQGNQRQLQCEIFDIHAWMHNRVLADDLRRYRLPNGYGAEVIEPLKQHRLTYADLSRQNSVELEVTALNPAIMFADGRHFEQAMTVRGELMLRGKRYDVDSYNVRDRSWGKPRPEASMPMPPTGWMTAVFGEDFSFTCNAFDDHRLMPEWGGQFAIADDKLLNGGWISRDGKVVSVTRCIKRTERDPSTLFPTRIEIEMTDATQKTYHVTGTVLAASEWFVQPMLRWTSVSVEWHCSDRVAFGEMQEAQWGDFTRAFVR